MSKVVRADVSLPGELTNSNKQLQFRARSSIIGVCKCQAVRMEDRRVRVGHDQGSKVRRAIEEVPFSFFVLRSPVV
ncbi:hypothetical protein B296_00004661 [Ensete ventricosum]|uniref:Uncharacterized protein n=1 Tax=Ensete ventricosum TaxID=4639 RepID=A0A426ZQJ0_ENSVE|nr:hypothetical protein B296_00004661 [Ensete ventricosum]